MKTQMPKIDLNRLAQTLAPNELDLVRGIVSTRGETKGCLRASKPEVELHEAGRDRYGLKVYEPDEQQGKVAYIWRMVAFYASSKSEHHCMPCTADFDLPGGFSESRELARYLDTIVDRVLSTIPKEQWHGIRRWGQVYGVVGTPQYDDEGAIIYR